MITEQVSEELVVEGEEPINLCFTPFILIKKGEIKYVW